VGDRHVDYEPRILKRIRIADGITYLVPPRSARSTFLGCAGILLEGARTAVIDANMGPEETLPLLEKVRPEVCVVSHFHVDHSRWAHEAASLAGAVVHVPAAEQRYLADVDHFVERCGIPDPELAARWRSWLTRSAGLRPVPDAVPLSPGETIDLGAMSIRVIDAAGHSPGHQAYWIEPGRILFCVDIGVDSFGPWYGWRDADLKTYVRSILRLAETDAALLVTSHGGIVKRDIRATILGCLDVMRARERVIRADLEAGLDVPGVAARGHIYGDVSRFPPPLDRAYYLWEENMVREHARLLRTGGVDAVSG